MFPLLFAGFPCFVVRELSKPQIPKPQITRAACTLYPKKQCKSIGSKGADKILVKSIHGLKLETVNNNTLLCASTMMIFNESYTIIIKVCPKFKLTENRFQQLNIKFVTPNCFCGLHL